MSKESDRVRVEDALAAREEFLETFGDYESPRDKRRKRRASRQRVLVVSGENGYIKTPKECTCTRCNLCPARFRCYTDREVELTEEEWLQIDETNGTGNTLLEWRESILNEMPFVDVKEYSHNIISLALGAISRGWGQNMADKVITEFSLDELGWVAVKKA